MGSDIADPRQQPQLLRGLHHDPARFRQRGAGRPFPGDAHVPFLERGQRRPAHQRQGRQTGQRDGAGDEPRRAWRADSARQDGIVARLEPPHEGRLPVIDRRAAQQHHGERRGYEHGYRHGNQDRQHIGDRKRTHECPQRPAQQEQRRHGEDEDQGRIDRGAAGLDAGLENDSRRGPAIASAALPAQPPHDVLYVDNGVVDDDSQRDREAGHNHRIDGDPTQIEHEPGRYQRQRDHHDADQRGTPREKPGGENQDEEAAADQQRAADIFDRKVDEAGRPIDRCVDRDAGQPLAQLVQCDIDAANDLHGIGIREPLDHEQQARVVVDDGVADERRMLLDHLGHIAQAQRFVRVVCDGHLGQLGGRGDGLDVLNPEPLIGGIDPPAGTRRRCLQEAQGRKPHGVAGGLDDLLEGHPLIPQLLGIDLHLQLA